MSDYVSTPLPVPRTIGGLVNRDASIHRFYDTAGFGALAIELVPGVYEVQLERPFVDIPAIVVAQNHPEFSALGAPVPTTGDNARLVAISHDRFQVAVGDNDGNPGPRHFTFVGFGPLND